MAAAPEIDKGSVDDQIAITNNSGFNVEEIFLMLSSDLVVAVAVDVIVVGGHRKR